MLDLINGSPTDTGSFGSGSNRTRSDGSGGGGGSSNRSPRPAPLGFGSAKALDPPPLPENTATTSAPVPQPWDSVPQPAPAVGDLLDHFAADVTVPPWLLRELEKALVTGNGSGSGPQNGATIPDVSSGDADALEGNVWLSVSGE